jgi:hypothetical protein
VKRGEVKQRIRKAAKAKGKSWALLRQGAQHEIWVCGSTSVAIPRHNELKLGLVLGIFRRLEPELGAGWWK